MAAIATTKQGKVEGEEVGGIAVFPRHPVRGASGRRPPLAGAPAARGVVRRARREGVRERSAAELDRERSPAGLLDPRAAERGLPLPEHLDAAHRRRAPTRPGVDPRGRVHPGLGRPIPVRRRAAREARRRRGGDDQLPARRARLPAPAGADRRAHSSTGNEGLRPARGARLGAREHRGLRRRPRERDHLRRVRGRHERGHAARPPQGARPVPQGDPAERRLQHGQHPRARGEDRRALRGEAGSRTQRRRAPRGEHRRDPAGASSARAAARRGSRSRGRRHADAAGRRRRSAAAARAGVAGPRLRGGRAGAGRLDARGVEALHARRSLELHAHRGDRARALRAPDGTGCALRRRVVPQGTQRARRPGHRARDLVASRRTDLPDAGLPGQTSSRTRPASTATCSAGARR